MQSELVTHEVTRQRQSRMLRSLLVVSGVGAMIHAITRRSVPGIFLGLAGALAVYLGLRSRPVVRRLIEMESEGVGDTMENVIRIERSIIVEQPVHEVYEYWRILENLPTFMRHVVMVEKIGENAYHWVLRGALGASLEMDVELVVNRANEMLAWQTMSGSPLYALGVLRVRREQGGGTEVTLLLEYRTPDKASHATLKRILSDRPGAQIGKDLIRFKEVMEAGEIAPDTAVPGLL